MLKNGFTQLFQNFIRNKLERGNLYEIQIEEGVPRRSISAPYLKDVLLTPAAWKFLELLIR
ncbi:hypothetical protein [Paenibacillus ginsengarvi]|uniref:Uncharacterized protein n=1 Tax=Paenibacillus ginsengarvi TaxID=400777 RepID=A0A3B0CCD7_9BACL|nr:hypothetical protein [Paenibacillus ginsengarvi]RKN82251.1 hypothetical protein D7M11_18090 [Paenibacillus ginsengarvi]